jgi:hypothetical protein
LRHLSADDPLYFQKPAFPVENRGGLISKLKFSSGSRLVGRRIKPQSSSPIYPKCHKPMQFLLNNGECQRVLRCADCGQPDPMQNADVQG